MVQTALKGHLMLASDDLSADQCRIGVNSLKIFGGALS